MAKDRIIEVLGEDELRLPQLLRRALSANDRVKYLLTLLQTARAAADGAEEAPDLHEERVDSGVERPLLDRVVASSEAAGGDRYRIPEAGDIARQALGEVDTMLAPLHASGSPAAAELAERLASVTAALTLEGDLISGADIARLTQAGRDDSLHLVVMSAHRQLNELAERLATETIDGAHAHGLERDDRTLVRAFMAGVHETDRLRFEHPGLGTTATRLRDALVIQNDIGETDAHVVVVRIVGHRVTITYTDVHLERLVFFQRLFAAWEVDWEDTRSRSDESMEDGFFHMALGRLDADEGSLEAFLHFLGSRLVFMIDWNRARKRLRGLVGKRAAIQLLEWSAGEGYGHRAFLIAGGDRLVYDALEFAGGRAARPGDNLRDALGSAGARAYLHEVLRICSEGMLANRPVSLIQDEVRTELIGYLRSAREQLLELVVRHGELVVEIGESTRDVLELSWGPDGEARAATAARRARDWEREADDVVSELRATAERIDDAAALLDLVEASDDAADSLEEAAFYLTLLGPARPSTLVEERLRRMCALVVTSARIHLRALQLAGDVQQEGTRQEIDAFLEAAHGVVSLERDVDDAQRDVHAALVGDRGEATELFVLVEATRGLEEAADALMHSAQLLRDQVLGRVMRVERPASRPRPAVEHPAPPLELAGDLYAVDGRDRPPPDAGIIGAKAHGLAHMTAAGLRVPEAVVLTTAVSRRFIAEGGVEGLRDLLEQVSGALEARTGRRLGNRHRPLLVSVRSGAPVSMPGMLETVLDVGLSDETVRAVVGQTGNPRLAWDSYRRLVESFASVVQGCSPAPFEEAVRRVLKARGADRPLDLEAAALHELTASHLQRFHDLTGAPFPQDPLDQLEQAVLAVLRSWAAPKARDYRHHLGLPEDLGTAVIVQRMVFGNAGGRSGSGVAFTRDPALGERRLYLDFLMDAQGEDVVSGRHRAHGAEDLAALAPDLHEAISEVCPVLEREFGDAQEFELTVEDGELFLLQTRTAKRTPWAALRIAVDQVEEGLIAPREALARLEGLDLDSIRRVRVVAQAEREPLARAIAASVGVATGPLALDAEAGERFAEQGRAPVLVRHDTSTEDIAAMLLSGGILTATGGRTSHAAVVARELGTPCLVGCAALEIDLDARTARLGSNTLAEGDVLTLDAESGLVLAGEAELVEERPTAALEAVSTWRADAAAGTREVARSDG
jgi:pyruvate, orthophosphate dikinase